MKLIPFLAAVTLIAYLGIHNGYLAIYEPDANEPKQVLPYRAALYPKIDQEALKEKIPIDSSQKLKQLLEDFLS